MGGVGGGAGGGATVTVTAAGLPHATFEGCRTIGYWTDVEGNWEYFNKLVAQSKAVQWGGSGSGSGTRAGVHRPLELREGCGFVFGGDCFDKGPGDIRISRLLVELKQAYPDRVALIMGNRVSVECGARCGGVVVRWCGGGGVAVVCACARVCH